MIFNLRRSADSCLSNEQKICIGSMAKFTLFVVVVVVIDARTRIDAAARPLMIPIGKYASNHQGAVS